MIKVKITNWKTDKIIEFNCLSVDVDKGFYIFYIDDFGKRYVPSYDWFLDLIYPVEQKINKT